MTPPDHRAAAPPPVATTAYEERLLPPVSWWVLALLLVVSAVAAVGLYVGPVWAIVTTVASGVVAYAVLVRPAVRIVVSPGELRVGRNVLEYAYLGACRALSAEETARRSGPEADARAYLVLRPFVTTAVEITLDDAADPVPYWLVSSRRPERLAAAVDGARTAGTAAPPHPAR